MKMDMSKYLQVFLKATDLTSGRPMTATIEDVVKGKFDDDVLCFTSGSKLSLNMTNGRALTAAYGPDSAVWKGKVIELRLGETTFEGELKATIIATPVSPAGERTPVPSPPPFDDKIPF